MNNIYPFDNSEILKKKKSIIRRLAMQEGLIEKRVAILSGSTIGDISTVLEVFLLSFGIKPKFYIGGYNRFYEEALFENRELDDFAPDIIYIHTSLRNLDDEISQKLQETWSKLRQRFSCPIIQNNFELPRHGSWEDCRRVNGMNLEIAAYAEANKDFYINDIQWLSAAFGLDNWFNDQEYFLYKYAFSVKAIPQVCYNIAKIIKFIYGGNQKCLVLDLDDTLWGGVVGEVGSMGIELGADTAIGEAFINFQKYAKSLHEKGIILAVCSKNDEKIAKAAFTNPNMILRLEDISVFCANWESKADNIQRIAEELNILPESIVFVDDNPAERELVRLVLPQVKVPEANSACGFIDQIEGAGYFYSPRVSEEDEKRNEYYAVDAKRNAARAAFVDYGDYLRSLEMRSEIRPFTHSHMDRITQLINKTNQFNLTTKRYSLGELEKISADSRFITLYADLEDKFGTNGIVSAIIGEIDGKLLHIRLWVLSCRVFKRELELAVFDKLAEDCRSMGLERIIGYYFKTPKNGYAAGLLEELGFSRVSDDTWALDLTGGYTHKNKYIQIRSVGANG